MILSPKQLPHRPPPRNRQWPIQRVANLRFEIEPQRVEHRGCQIFGSNLPNRGYRGQFVAGSVDEAFFGAGAGEDGGVALRPVVA